MAIGGIIGSVAGGLIQSSSAKKAAKAQEAAANRDIEFQKETRDLIRADLKPFYGAGTNALAAYQYELGLSGTAPTFGGNQLTVEEIAAGASPGGSSGGVGAAANGQMPRGLDRSDRENWRLENRGNLTQTAAAAPSFKVGDKTFATREEAQAYADANSTPGFQYQGYQLSPDYLYQIDEGAKGINALAGAQGGLLSGKTLEALTTMRQGIAAQGRNNYLNRLAGLTDTGQSAAAMQGTASSNAAAGVSNALSGIGNAQAAGAIGQGNAFSGMFSDVSKWLGYQNGGSGYGGKTYTNVYPG